MLRRVVAAWVDRTAERAWFLSKHAAIAVKQRRFFRHDVFTAWRSVTAKMRSTARGVRNALGKIANETKRLVFTEWRDHVLRHLQAIQGAADLEEAGVILLGTTALQAWCAWASVMAGARRQAQRGYLRLGAEVWGGWERVVERNGSLRQLREGVKKRERGRVWKAWGARVQLAQRCRDLHSRVRQKGRRQRLLQWREAAQSIAATRARWPCAPACLLGV